MDTPVVTRSLIALIVITVLLAFTAWSLWRVRYNPFAKRLNVSWWRELYVGALIAAAVILLWSLYNAATLFLRAVHAVASTKGVLQ